MQNNTINLFRIFLTFGVIWIHVHSSNEAVETISLVFSALCVPFFYSVAIGLYFVKLPKDTVFQITRKTFHRLLIPYLSWTLIYSTLLLLKHILSHQHTGLVFWRLLFYGESAVQLYFLPQLIIMQLTSLALFHLFSITSYQKVKSILLLSFTMFYFYWGSFHNCFGNTPFLTISFYLLAGWLFSKVYNQAKPNWVYVLLGIILITLPLYSILDDNTLSNNTLMLQIPIGGISLLLLATGLPALKMPDWITKLSSITFGIYLSHVVFLELMETCLEKLHIAIYYGIINKLLITSIIFALSVLFTLTTRRINRLKFLLLGE